MAQYHTNQRQRGNAALQQAAQSALPLQLSLQVSRKLDCTKSPIKDAQPLPGRAQIANAAAPTNAAPQANAARKHTGDKSGETGDTDVTHMSRVTGTDVTRQSRMTNTDVTPEQAEKITCLIPSHGIERPPIVPSPGIDSALPIPPHGTMLECFGGSSIPSPGNHLEKPSVPGFKPSTSEKFSASHHDGAITAEMEKQLPHFTGGPASCYIANKPKGPVTQKHQIRSGCTSTEKRGFVTPKFWGPVHLHASSQWLRGVVGATRKDARTASDVFLTATLHQLHSKMRTVVSSLIPEGTETMTAITKASRRAAPAPTATGTPDLIQLHADAHNALNMAVFYLRQPDANVAGARRKAIQALSALRGLSLALEG